MGLEFGEFKALAVECVTLTLCAVASDCCYNYAQGVVLNHDGFINLAVPVSLRLSLSLSLSLYLSILSIYINIYSPH